ncbi:NAD-glutamate dehydrogenase [Modestobacter sp. VKM Ac-2979]|uniref:NAD-glutamate dehydrogenase domain-containing protein n=1 Tax=unclassified Modestobacter TaxID=2643866 RepID=UPI0022AB7058|nr:MULTISPECIES: NAD-glutamate dehydrogenase domain-containing protein [unclassified Modestobacter]MCZ2811972.1 NAD-glutamate dehydrogenase [Modestobacter sp. VKM Ac-2979]MCZ2843696.1 NAD-glutamate dehydrogenase [Modestobacter sp. VKM Ac-2980]
MKGDPVHDRVRLRPAPAGRGPLVGAVVEWPSTRPLLADVVPVFERLGVRVADARPLPEVGGTAMLLDLLLPEDVATEPALAALGQALAAAWAGETELDGLAQLTVTEGLPVLQVTVLRAACRYLAQTGTGLSRAYIEQMVLGAPRFARALIRRFFARHDPDARDAAGAAAAGAELESLLDATTSLDEDRILRGLRDVLDAVLRTNAFQDPAGRPPAQLALKIASPRLTFLPAPRPWVETFVHSPTVEGLHLRGGPVARGGLRWSDRPEDYRTEVLGLLKAQLVKNAVIVPAGAKGAFVVRGAGDQTAVEHAYRSFVAGLLDITDNRVDGRVVHPARTVVLDQDDAYLVVAADKGTATFSDLANELAVARGFWLGDAFASGGSVGYDHKAMGITARGAWVAVRRHLRELGVDPDVDEITAVGIGDMSGDVFGNGMLLYERLRLVAAFDHRHVFLDPDPDLPTSYAERRRLAALPGSSWADYDPSVLSPGGAVYRRDAKRVLLSPEVRRRLGTEAHELTPDELIQAVLRAPVDLLWNGGIGTYVRADDETDAQVGDRTNERVRVTAATLRCRLIGEGGNLGLTQRARIAAARAGVRVNTDFIDNAAGVDTSDREVNLKILLADAVREGELSVGARDDLLRTLTDEVATAVLADTAHQVRALTVCAERAPFLLDRHAGLIRDLEQHAGLDRGLEHLPSEADVERLRAAGGGLTRPEASVLLAYSKNLVREELLGSDLPDDPALRGVLLRYFPRAVRERWPDRIAAHPLAREITATQLASDLLDRVGPGFLHRLEERHSVGTPIAARAFAAAQQALKLDAVWAMLDEDVPPSVERLALPEAQRATERVADRLLRRYPDPVALTATVPALTALVADVHCIDDTMAQQLRAAGACAQLADGVAALASRADALDLAGLVETTGLPVYRVLDRHWALGRALGIDRVPAAELAGDSTWELAAKTVLREQFDEHIRALTASLLADGGDVDRFLDRHSAAIGRFTAVRDAAATAQQNAVALLAVLTDELLRLRQAAA